jgi:hypothetical protein
VVTITTYERIAKRAATETGFKPWPIYQRIRPTLPVPQEK